MSIIWCSNPNANASVVAPALGECSPYNEGLRPAHFNIDLNAEYAVEYDKGFSGSGLYSDPNVSHFSGGNKYICGDGKLESNSRWCIYKHISM